jgi:hypothetical protein
LAIATVNSEGEARIAAQVTNEVDWDQHYMPIFSVAEIIITGADYLKRIDKLGPEAQNILDMMTKGKFAYLGDWREKHGFHREPDVAILSRSLDFPLPEQIEAPNRKIIVFTTDGMAKSEKADELRKLGLEVVATGEEGADGEKIADWLNKMHYKTAMMTTGPRVLQVFTEAGKMDFAYINIVEREIPGKLVTVLPAGKNFSDFGFSLYKSGGPENVKTNDGAVFPQRYEVWAKKETLDALAA